MDLEKYNEKKNNLVMQCWLIIVLVITAAYILEYLKGARTLEYTVRYLAIAWILWLSCYIIMCCIGKSNLKIRYAISIAYIMFYIFTQITSHSVVTFVYIFPMMSVTIVYDDLKLLDLTNIAVILTNFIYIVYTICKPGNVLTADLLTLYEIQLACLALCTVFLHNTCKLLKYSDEHLFKLNKEVTTDSLTHTKNIYFLKKYTKNLDENENLSLAIIDIDNFKSFNDKYGHKFGDLVLKRMSSIFRDLVGEIEDTYVVRVGGDEFIILSKILNKNDMYNMCDNICSEVAGTILNYDSHDVNVTISIGIANNRVDKINDYNTLYKLADSRLYTVKANGKSSVAQ